MGKEACVNRLGLHGRGQRRPVGDVRDFDAATEDYRSALALSPGDPDILLQLSYMASLAGCYRSAHGYALQASQHDTQRVDVVKELLARLRALLRGEQP